MMPHRPFVSICLLINAVASGGILRAETPPVVVSSIAAADLAELQKKADGYFATADFERESAARIELIARLSQRYGFDSPRVTYQKALHRGLLHILSLPDEERRAASEARRRYSEAEILFWKNHNSDSIPKYRQAYDDYVLLVGADDPVAVEMRWQTAIVMSRSGDKERAIDALVAVASPVGKQFGPAYESSVMNSLSINYRDVGEHDKSISAGKRALDLAGPAWGDRSAEAASIALNLAVTCNASSRFGEAKKYAADAAASFASFGDGYVGFVLSADFENAASLAGEGRNDEAAAAYQKALLALDKLKHDDPSQVRRQLVREYSRFAAVLEKLGRREEAKTARDNADRWERERNLDDPV